MSQRSLHTSCIGIVGVSPSIQEWPQMSSLEMQISSCWVGRGKETSTIPRIPGYMVQSVAQKARRHRGQEGVACIYRAYLQDKITIAKVHTHHGYMGYSNILSLLLLYPTQRIRVLQRVWCGLFRPIWGPCYGCMQFQYVGRSYAYGSHERPHWGYADKTHHMD